MLQRLRPHVGAERHDAVSLGAGIRDQGFDQRRSGLFASERIRSKGVVGDDETSETFEMASSPLSIDAALGTVLYGRLPESQADFNDLA